MMPKDVELIKVFETGTLGMWKGEQDRHNLTQAHTRIGFPGSCAATRSELHAIALALLPKVIDMAIERSKVERGFGFDRWAFHTPIDSAEILLLH